MMNKLSYPRTTIFLITLWLAGMIGLLVVNPTLFFVILEKELWIANIVSILVFIMGTIGYFRNMDFMESTLLIQYNKTSLIWFLDSTIALIVLMLVKSIF